MVVLDGRFYQAHPDGRISLPADSAPVPFAALTTFRPLHRAALSDIGSMDQLTASLDRMRRSQNLFFAVRLDGTFSELHFRVACKVQSGMALTEATRHQAEFHLAEQRGTIVGLWSPSFSRMVAVPGWHFHFLSEDRTTGGHLLDCKAARLEVQLQDIDDLRLAMPETRRFLQADLTGDPTAALAKAERTGKP